MTLPTGDNGPPISLSDLNAEFGYGTSLAAYHGRIIGTPGGGVTYYNGGSTISLSSFYGTNKVSGGSASLTSGSSYYIGQYKTIRFTVTAAGGGGGGGRGGWDGTCLSAYGGSGSNGGASTFGAVGDAWRLSSTGGGGGGGGTTSTGLSGSTYSGNIGSGSNGGAGGSGARDGGPGGAGAKNQTGYFDNPVMGGTGPYSGGYVGMSIGGGGGGGAGSTARYFNGTLCAFGGTANNGSSGGGGSILVEWTGED